MTELPAPPPPHPATQSVTIAMKTALVRIVDRLMVPSCSLVCAAATARKGAPSVECLHDHDSEQQGFGSMRRVTRRVDDSHTWVRA